MCLNPHTIRIVESKVGSVYKSYHRQKIKHKI